MTRPVLTAMLLSIWTFLAGCVGDSTIRSSGHEISGLSFVHKGSCVVSGGFDEKLRLWDARTGQCTRVINSSDGWIMRIASSPDENTLAVANVNDSMSLWDTASWTIQKRLNGHAGPVLCVAYSPDGRHLASCGRDGTVRLWDLSQDATAGILHRSDQWIEVVAFSPDGRYLASGDWNGEINVWDVPTKKHVKTIGAHTDAILSMAFSPSGEWLASGAQDKDALAIWDTENWQRKTVLLSDGQDTRGLAFLSDKRLISAGNDGVIRFWDLESNEQTNALKTHDGWITAMALSTDATCLATGTSEGVVRLLKVDAIK